MSMSGEVTRGASYTKAEKNEGKVAQLFQILCELLSLTASSCPVFGAHMHDPVITGQIMLQDI